MTKFRFIGLIISSLALLGVFETLWLLQVWKEQSDSLHQETEYLFQHTVATLQDSLVRRSMTRNHIMPDDMLLRRTPQTWQLKTPAPMTMLPPPFEANTNMVVRVEKNGDRFKRDSFRVDQMQIFIATADSGATITHSGVDRLLLNLPDKIRQFSDKERFFQIEKDTLSTAELEREYREKLQTSGISLPFHLYQTDSLPFHLNAGGINTQPAFAGLLVHRFYSANFPEYRAYLWRKMLPSLAFAILLFGVTAAAFTLIYRSLRQQQRLTRLKNEFISNITHELKTPITTVGVALEALSDFQALHDPEKTREYLALSKLELERLSLLVDKVLRLSMFEDQVPRLQPEMLDLATLARQVAGALTLQAERAGTHIRLEIPSGSDFTVQGDRLHLSSVIFNLLDNALKYTTEAPDIRLCLEKAPGLVRLSVSDNGIGIAPDDQARVFEKFFRAPSGNRHDVKGHGLGLSYAAQVVRQHGGEIRLESTPGKGSTFIVELPGVDDRPPE